MVPLTWSPLPLYQRAPPSAGTSHHILPLPACLPYSVIQARGVQGLAVVCEPAAGADQVSTWNKRHYTEPVECRRGGKLALRYEVS